MKQIKYLLDPLQSKAKRKIKLAVGSGRSLYKQWGIRICHSKNDGPTDPEHMGATDTPSWISKAMTLCNTWLAPHPHTLTGSIIEGNYSILCGSGCTTYICSKIWLIQP